MSYVEACTVMRATLDEIDELSVSNQLSVLTSAMTLVVTRELPREQWYHTAKPHVIALLRLLKELEREYSNAA